MLKRSHEPVMTAEVLTGLAIIKDGYYIDATFGRGGHSQNILESLGPKGRLLAIDQDPSAIAAAKFEPFINDARFQIELSNFAEIGRIVETKGWTGKVNGILLDLGVSSPQLDDPKRGFSFMQTGPLDMRMNPQSGRDAASWLNQAPEREIAKVIKEFGEERFASKIAAAVVRARSLKPLQTTTELAELVTKTVPKRETDKHPATRTFQALRVFINKELSVLASCLTQSLTVLAPGGRLVVISFHSLEDQIVKEFMQTESQGVVPHKLPLREHEMVRRLKVINRLIRPTEIEIQRNRRARSARLRIMEKII